MTTYRSLIFFVALFLSQLYLRAEPGGRALHSAGQQLQTGGSSARGQRERGAVEETAGGVSGGDGETERTGEPPCSSLTDDHLHLVTDNCRLTLKPSQAVYFKIVALQNTLFLDEMLNKNAAGAAVCKLLL